MHFVKGQVDIFVFSIAAVKYFNFILNFLSEFGRSVKVVQQFLRNNLKDFMGHPFNTKNTGYLRNSYQINMLITSFTWEKLWKSNRYDTNET